jgi:hypothetical protein
MKGNIVHVGKRSSEGTVSRALAKAALDTNTIRSTDAEETIPIERKARAEQSRRSGINLSRAIGA